MRCHHFFLGLLLLVVLGSGIFATSHYGWYPVAMTNGQFILARDFYQVSRAAYYFYNKTLSVGQKTLSPSEAQSLYQETQKTALQKLINEALVAAEFSRAFGSASASLIDKKLASVDNAKLIKPAAELYNLSFEDFRRIILEPAARTEILADNFKVNKQNFDQWLAEARQKAKITILLPGLE